VKPARKGAKAEATRERIVAAALAAFRSRGFDRTTMRDIARAAGVAVGAAYYYFPSKGAIVLAYYERLHEEHLARVRVAFAAEPALRARLGAAIHSKLDLLAHDRKLLAALFRSAGEPGDPAWVFGAETRRVREQNIAVFAEAIAPVPLPADLQALLPPLLWLVNVAVLLFFVRDRSPRQTRTRQLVDGALDLIVDLVGVVGLPGLAPLRGRVAALLEQAGLLGGDR
jgi:AcrR family transcriptional regulator